MVTGFTMFEQIFIWLPYNPKQPPPVIYSAIGVHIRGQIKCGKNIRYNEYNYVYINITYVI